MSIVSKILGIVVLGSTLSACYKEPSFEKAPKITFEDISKDIRIDQFNGANKDSIMVNIFFQDGDGDLGYNETEKAVAQATDDYNYLIRTFRKTKGTFTEFTPLVPLSGYFPKLKTDGRTGPIEGFLAYKIEFLHPFTPKRDTVKFAIRIKDLSGNVSNEIETEEVVLNQF